jgi:membrane-associated phospholipid phosphatase
MKRLVSFLLLLQVHTASAQTASDSLIEATDTLSPGKVPWKKLAAYSGLTFGYAVATFYCFKEEDNHFRKEVQEHRTLFKDRVAHSLSPLGTGDNHWIAVGATAGIAYLTKDTRLQKTVFIWAVSLGLNDAVTNTLKEHVQRHRPNTGMPYNTFDRRRGPKVNRSFPSAHASNAFTTATVFATEYKDKHWVAPVAYGAAIMVCFSRVYNNAHWASDIMAGAAVGFLSAKAIVMLEKQLARKNIQLYPLVGPSGGSVRFVKKF